MPSSSIENISKQIHSRKLEPVYFLMGEEPYYIDLIVKEFEDHLLTEDEKEFNLTTLYGKETNVSEIISAAKRYPMMSDFQLILVKEAQNLDKIENLVDYVKNSMSSTVLVVAYKYKKLDQRKSLYKTLEKQGVTFLSEKIKEDKLPAWIQQYVGTNDYKISVKATALLIESLGNDLSKISNELTKLMINIKKGSEITENNIEYYIGISKDYNVFELQDAISKKNVVKSMKIINYFMSNPKEHPIHSVLPLLYSNFVKLLIYHSLSPKMQGKELAAAMGIPPFFINQYRDLSKNYSFGKTIKIISLFREYDLKSKGLNIGSTPNEQLLKEFAYKILN